MPVEIKELVIRVTATGTKTDDGSKTAPGQSGQPPVALETLVETCVKQVLKILEKKKLR